MPMILNIQDLRELAKRRIPRAIFDYATAARTMNARFDATPRISTP